MNKRNKISKLNIKMANPLDWLWEPSLPWMGRNNSEIKEQKRNCKENGEEEKENSHKYSNFLQTYFKLNPHNTKRLALFIIILEANLYMYIIWIQAIRIWKLSKMEAWCMVGGLVHGRWVGVWLVASSQQLLSDFQLDFHDLDCAFWLGGLMKVVASCLLEILQFESCHLDVQICQKHWTYLMLGWQNVFPNSNQLVASLSCRKRHLLTKWSSVKLEIWVLSFQWPSFSPRGSL